MLRSFGKRIPGDGNTAATSVAYQLSETSFIYPITPATTMGELVDAWIAQGRKNIWGNKVHMAMMQSEGGAAAAVHGATAVGALCATFTASQGALLMIPDMYKIIGEMCPAVSHISARCIATSALSIYNDHGDIYACRATGMPILFSNGVQEAHDLAAVAHLTTIHTGLPFIHTFDGFRTSHEINTYEELDNETLWPLIDQKALAAFRARSLNPEHPSERGTICGPEYVWQMHEKLRKPFQALPTEVEKMMKALGDKTGRYYKPYQYAGPRDPENVIIMMGSGCDPVEEYITEHPEFKTGLIKVHLFRPFSVEMFNAAIPASVKKICVLDKVVDPTGPREPLFEDVAAALIGERNVKIIGGRYGISSRDFAPVHVEAIVKNLASELPKDRFTVGVVNPETQLPLGKPFDHLPEGTKQCMFWGLGSDGTVGANKQAIKLIVSNTKLYGQAYFAYDAHKSGGVTTPHLRFGAKPINAPYYVQNADYIACHNPSYLHKFDMTKQLKKGGVFVINFPGSADLNKDLPGSFRKAIAEKDAKLYTIDATQIAIDLKLPGRINMLMQTVFFGLANIIPAEECIALLKKSIAKQYARKGKEVIQKNWDMVDHALQGLKEFKYNKAEWLNAPVEPRPKHEGIRHIIDMSILQEGESVSVDEMVEIGLVPNDTAKYEKRGIAVTVPKWEEKKCIQCNTCAMVCPHAVIRPFLLTQEEAKGLTTLKAKGKEIKNYQFRIQITPLDCTGCATCVTSCPTKALSMTYRNAKLDEEEGKNWDQCLAAPNRGHLLPPTNVRNVQFRQPLIEFNGACQGCGETAICKLLTQLYGDQLYLANATGCSLVWGATFPFNPFTTNERGHGPAWANSLFEDNAEFGYGMFKAVEARRNITKKLVVELLESGEIKGELKELFEQLLKVWDQDKESGDLAEKIKPLLAKVQNPSEKMYALQSQADILSKKQVWIVGGDGWAYDIGYGGLDHVLASGENVKIIIYDTEVYSNTGGQCSKATSRGAVANFSAAGYTKAKKDLGAIAMTYKNIYVASTCLLADPNQALKALQEAKEYNGPAIIINYSPCINHGIKKGLGSTPKHCKDLLKTGYLNLFRYNPAKPKPLTVDTKQPDYNLDPLVKGENRFAALKDIYPKEAETKFPQLINDMKTRYEGYKKIHETQ
uniref:pyruvate dehydrogenase (NADP(+)) n=1 Tax=Trichomonas vaginalis TaxID=5722 RepID=Q4KY23_TRIVA|nr:pyruvate:ferredoxin oxidoreductase A-like protein [Trichomonas vaginalis]